MTNKQIDDRTAQDEREAETFDRMGIIFLPIIVIVGFVIVFVLGAKCV